MNYVAGRREEYAREPTRDKREKRTIKLELLGRRFTVRSDDDDEYIQELVEFVNGKLHEIREATGKVEAENIALLAALDIADALFRERERNDAIKEQVRARSKRLLDVIDKVATLSGSDEVVREVHALAEQRARGR